MIRSWVAKIRRPIDVVTALQAQEHRLFAVLHIDLEASVGFGEGLPQGSSLFANRMQPSIRKRLAALADLSPREGFRCPLSRIGRFSAGGCKRESDKQLADDRCHFQRDRVGSLQSRCAQNRRHFVFLSGSQSDGCIQDIARLDTEELCPFAVA